MKKKNLDIYIDESGDFSPFSFSNPLYSITFVCVENINNSKNSISIFNEKIKNTKSPDHFVHVGNLVRKEYPYENLLIKERQDIFYILFLFCKKADYFFFNTVVNKKEIREKTLEEKISTSIFNDFNSKKAIFEKYESINLHYDGGQTFLKGVLSSLSSLTFTKFHLVKTDQKDSPFMQAADLLGFFELIKFKSCKGTLTKSEKNFFGEKRKIKKDYLKTLSNKILK